MAEQERKKAQKAMAYDLSRIFRQEPGKTYAAEELEKSCLLILQDSNSKQSGAGIPVSVF